MGSNQVLKVYRILAATAHPKAAFIDIIEYLLTKVNRYFLNSKVRGYYYCVNLYQSLIIERIVPWLLEST